MTETHHYYVDYEVSRLGENAGVDVYTDGPYMQRNKALNQAHYRAGETERFVALHVRLRTMVMVEKLELSETIK